MELTRRANVILLVVNVIGALLYVWRSSLGWAIPGEPVTGEPFIWFMAIAPVLAGALLINVPWTVMILRNRDWSSGRFWLLVALVWLIAMVIDFAHH